MSCEFAPAQDEVITIIKINFTNGITKKHTQDQINIL